MALHCFWMMNFLFYSFFNNILDCYYRIGWRNLSTKPSNLKLLDMFCEPCYWYYDILQVINNCGTIPYFGRLCVNVSYILEGYVLMLVVLWYSLGY